jgi:transposase InsO family protein
LTETALLEQHGITCSMSRRGNCYDNAVMESGFSTVKSEESDRFESYAHAKAACSTTSRCSITSGGGIRRSARSVRPNSKNARAHGVRIILSDVAAVINSLDESR